MCLFYKVAKEYFKVSVSYVILIFETVLCDRQWWFTFQRVVSQLSKHTLKNTSIKTQVKFPTGSLPSISGRCVQLQLWTAYEPSLTPQNTEQNHSTL